MQPHITIGSGLARSLCLSARHTQFVWETPPSPHRGASEQKRVAVVGHPLLLIVLPLAQCTRMEIQTHLRRAAAHHSSCFRRVARIHDVRCAVVCCVA